MKAIITILTMTLLSMNVFAALPSETVRGAGITPDSPLYGLDLLVGNIQVSFTPQGIQRAQKMLEIADERLAETEVMIDRGTPQLATQSLADEQAKSIAADNEISTSITPQDVTSNVATLDIINARLTRRQVVIQAIIDRIKNDDNPNNDNALQGLMNALSHAKQSREKTKMVEDTADKYLKERNLPGVVEARQNTANPNVRSAIPAQKQSIYQNTPLVDDSSTQARAY